MTYYLYTDGACKGNPGMAGGGAVIYNENMERITSASENFGITTNNVAEYKALILGLNLCKDNSIPFDKLIIRMDSELIVKQLSGIYRVKNEILKNLYNEIKKNYTWSKIEHVYRTDNKEADAMANIGVNLI